MAQLTKSYLLLHCFDCHYEMIPSVISYFGSVGDLDCVIEFSKYIHDTTDGTTLISVKDESSESTNKSWIQIYDKLNIPYRIIGPPALKSEYDYIIMDTEDPLLNWTFINTYMSSHQNRIMSGQTKFLTVLHNNNVLRSRELGIARSFDIKKLSIQGIHLHNPFLYHRYYYHCSVPLIDPEKKYKLVSSSNIINVCIVGDIVNREFDIVKALKMRISNHHVIKFHFINRNFNSKFLQSIEASAATKPAQLVSLQQSGLNYKLHESLNATALFNILFIADAIYYYPENFENIGRNCTGSFNLAYSSLSKFICPFQFIEEYEMNPQCGYFLNHPRDSVVVNKLTQGDIQAIENDAMKMREKTKEYLGINGFL